MGDCKHTYKLHPDVGGRFYCTKCGEIVFPFERIEQLEREVKWRDEQAKQASKLIEKLQARLNAVTALPIAMETMGEFMPVPYQEAARLCAKMVRKALRSDTGEG